MENNEMSKTPTLDAVPEAKREYAGFLKNNMREYGMLLSLVAIMAFFQVMTDGTLMQPLNLTNLVLQNSYVVIMALGMLMVIVAGHIDLSVGSVVGFIGALAAVLIVNYDMNFIPAGFQRLSSGFIPDPIAAGDLRLTSLLVGVVLVCAFLYVNVRARAKHAKNGMADEPFAIFLGKNVLLAAVIVYFSYLMATYRGMPNVLIVMALLIVLYTFVSSRTVIGRRVYAVGGNEKASKLSGIKTERVTFYTFVNMGVLAALAGLIFAARLNTATPKAGTGFELDVIAASFIGGASASGGVGKVMGAVIGAFIMGVMNNGMSIMGIGIDYQQVIKGLVLLAAVFFDVYNKNK